MIIEVLNDGYVEYKCDSCNELHKVKLSSLKRKDRVEHQICRKCTIILNNVVEKRKNTCIEKYGVENPMHVEKFKHIAMLNNNVYDKQRTSLDTIRNSFLNEGYTLLSTEYINNKHNLSYICNNNHNGTISWNSWINGRRCRQCGILNSTKKISHSIEFVRKCLADEGYELISDTYVNKHIPIMYRCPKGHIGTIRFGNWLHNQTRCSSCSHIESNAEIELREFIKICFPDLISNNRTLIKPLELDIVIPSQKLAIEYNGLYYHSSDKLGKWYHLEKLNKCKEIGYRLITIFEDEWLYKSDIVKHRLLNILGVRSEKPHIYARNCSIKEIDNSTKNIFLDKFHLQGKDTSSIRLGAFHDDRLISIMTFSKGSLAKGNYNPQQGIYELNRFCSDYNYYVVGIASKLLKCFTKTYTPKSVFSYADKRWSDGNLYNVLGFTHQHDSEPNYWYIFGDRRIHRFNFRKSELKKKLDIFDPTLSEIKNMSNNGYNRIFDCGNSKWIFKLV